MNFDSACCRAPLELFTGPDPDSYPSVRCSKCKTPIHDRGRVTIDLAVIRTRLQVKLALMRRLAP